MYSCFVFLCHTTNRVCTTSRSGNIGDGVSRAFNVRHAVGCRKFVVSPRVEFSFSVSRLRIGSLVTYERNTCTNVESTDSSKPESMGETSHVNDCVMKTRKILICC